MNEIKFFHYNNILVFTIHFEIRYLNIIKILFIFTFIADLPVYPCKVYIIFIKLELFPHYVFEIYRINHLTYQKNVKKMSEKCL
jgi:hypothetical protein